MIENEATSPRDTNYSQPSCRRRSYIELLLRPKRMLTCLGWSIVDRIASRALGKFELDNLLADRVGVRLRPIVMVLHIWDGVGLDNSVPILEAFPVEAREVVTALAGALSLQVLSTAACYCLGLAPNLFMESSYHLEFGC